MAEVKEVVAYLNSLDNPYCLMLMGLPASGKTTFRSEILRGGLIRSPTVISTDDLITEFARDNGMSYTEAFSSAVDSATRAASEKVRVATDNRESVIVDQTNLTKKARGRKLKQFPRVYMTVGVYIEASLDETYHRLTRRGDSGAGVDVFLKLRETLQRPEASEFDKFFTS